MNVIRFHAKTISGSGRGKTIGTPTINVDLTDVPQETEEGIYAGWARIDDAWRMAAIHYGPRPVFKDIPSFEVHLLDTVIESAPETIDIALVKRMREIRDFPSTDALTAQIADDVRTARAILEAHGSPGA